jgi:sugar/nucleoside kinase (ribokinase family)
MPQTRSTRYEVLLPGPYFCDLIFSGLEELSGLGTEVFSREFSLLPGGCFHTVHALHRLDVRVGWACDFGNDPISQLTLAAIRDRGIDDALIRLVERPLCMISATLSLAHDRAFVTYLDRLPSRAYASLVARE